MAINKKLIHFKNKTDFQTLYNAGNILSTSIVFIQDAKQIWTHELFYSCPFTEDEIKQLFTGANIKLNNYVEIESIIDIKATDTVNEAFGKIENYLDSLSDLNAVLVNTGDVASDPIINDYISPSELNLTLTNYATKNLLNINDTGAKVYTDNVIKNLVNAAPETLDTLGELATAIKDNQEVINILDAAITNKLDKTEAVSIYVTKEELSIIPAGTVILCILNPDEDWVECDGSLINVDQYPNVNLSKVFTGQFLETFTIDNIKTVYEVASNGNIAVMHDSDDIFKYSTDGINWINTNNNPGYSRNIDIVCDGECFYLVCSYGELGYNAFVNVSKDGINWTKVTLTDVAYISRPVADTVNGGAWFCTSSDMLYYIDSNASITEVTLIDSTSIYTLYYNNGSVIVFSGSDDYRYYIYEIINGKPTYKTNFKSNCLLHLTSISSNSNYYYGGVVYNNILLSGFQECFDLNSMLSKYLYYDLNSTYSNKNGIYSIINGLVYDTSNNKGSYVSLDGIHYKYLPNINMLLQKRVFNIGNNWYYINNKLVSKLSFDKKILPYKPGHYIKIK